MLTAGSLGGGGGAERQPRRARRRRRTQNGEWRMENGEWTMENGSPSPLNGAEHFPHLFCWTPRGRNADGESQRDSDPKPRVARNELPWECWSATSTPTGLRLRVWTADLNPVGVE